MWNLGNGKVEVSEGNSRRLYKVLVLLVSPFEIAFVLVSDTFFLSSDSGYHQSFRDLQNHYTVDVEVNGRFINRRFHVY